MSPLGKLALGLAGAVAVVVLFLVLRPDESAETQPAEPAATAPGVTAPAGTGGETPTETTEEDPPEPGPRVVRLDVRVDDPEIARIEVNQGERVVLIVRADVVEHVHVHGYDLLADVAPGQPGRIAFRATIPGRFDIELEDRHQHIAQLIVR